MKHLRIFATVFILTFFYNCDNEPIDPAIQIVPEFSCEDAVLATAVATNNFSSATQENFTALCNQLSSALEAQISVCGDPNGSLQLTINALDCNANTTDPCEVASNVLELAEIGFNDADGSTYSQKCNDYKTALQLQISACGDEDGSIQNIIDALGTCVQSGGGSTDSYALMTANLIGEPYNNLVPFFYPLTDATSTVTFTQDSTTEVFLKIQGNSNRTEVTVFSKEINLYIPESLWAVGTYGMDNDPFDDDMNPTAHYDMIYNNGDGTSQTYEPDNGGSITITEIDLQQRFIKGTFEFIFTRSFVGTGEETGPFECTDGTFNYSLDAPYFD